METIQYPCGRDVIERVLPHRDPFVWVSRVLECEPGSKSRTSPATCTSNAS